MATARTVWMATDGSQWDRELDAVRRDLLDAAVRAIEATLPRRPTDSDQRVVASPAAFAAAKRAVVELCRTQYPHERIFRYPAEEINVRSFAGRFLDEASGPLGRAWFTLSCYCDGWLYDQPYFAINPHEFKGTDILPPSAADLPRRAFALGRRET